MSIAVVSGSGFLGSAIAKRLLAHGQMPVVIHRGREKGTVPPGAIIEHCDRMDDKQLISIFKSRQVSAVIDILALTADNTRPVIAATSAIGARYILTSSIDVYANYGGLLGKEHPDPLLAPATEDSPLRQARYPYRGNERRPQGVDDGLLDNYDKLVLEEMARGEPKIAATILRAPMIFGPGDKQHRFAWAIAAAREAEKNGTPIRFDARAAAWLNSYGFIEDVAEAFALAATKPGAAGRTYNVGQLQVRSAVDWLALILDVMGIAAKIELVAPEEHGLLHDRAEAMELRYPLTLDTNRIRTELGFAEVIDERAALVMTIVAEEAGR